MSPLMLKLSIQVHAAEIAEVAGLDSRYVAKVLTIGANKMKPTSHKPTGTQFRAITTAVATVLQIDYATAKTITRFGCLHTN